MKSYSTYCGRNYSPVLVVQADTEALATLGERLMFRHGSPTQPNLTLFVAQKGVLHAGWVIGVFDEPFYPAKTATVQATPGARFPFTGEHTVRRFPHIGWPKALQVCEICGGNHDHLRGHKWDAHTDDAVGYSTPNWETRTEK